MPYFAQATRRFHFDSAHHLPNYEGKCQRLHGHRWTLDVTIESRIDDTTGFVVDFSTMKKDLEPLLDRLDHHNLNEVLDNPTAENLCILLWEEIHNIYGRGLQKLRLYESPDSWIDYHGGL